jgi:hypothetical protein
MAIVLLMVISMMSWSGHAFKLSWGKADAVPDSSIAKRSDQLCDDQCGTGDYENTGACQRDGRCLCEYGWTGPNAVYVMDSANRIVADHCAVGKSD